MENFLNNLAQGLAVSFQPLNFLYIIAGTVVGLIAGALPGVTGTMGLAVLLPLTFWMSPIQAVMLLSGAFISATCSNSFPAVLIRTPGTPSAVLSCIEGYPFQERGEGGRALMLVLVPAIVGQFVSVLLLIAFVIPLALAGPYLLFPERAAVIIMGLIAAATLTGSNVVKGLLAAAFGIALSLIGRDPVTGQIRFTQGLDELNEGLGLIPVLIGLLAVSEVFIASRQMAPIQKIKGGISRLVLSLADMRLSIRPMAIGTVVGMIVGMLPGTGSAAAAFIAYGQAKQWAREPEMFGKGSLEGLVANETAQNASNGGELVPTLGLGVPGSGSAAIFMAALIIHGIRPGPELMRSYPEVLHAVFGSLLVATMVMGILGYLMIRPMVYITSFSREAIVAATLILVTTGTFSVNQSLFDVYMAILFGVIGYAMRRYGYSVAPTTLGFILGSLFEQNLRRGLLMTRGSWLAFFTRPITAGILLFTLVGVTAMYITTKRREEKLRAEVAALSSPDGIGTSAPGGQEEK